MPEVIKLLNDENVKPSLCDSVAVVLTVCSLDQPYRHLLGTHQRPNESDIWGAQWSHLCPGKPQGDSTGHFRPRTTVPARSLHLHAMLHLQLPVLQMQNSPWGNHPETELVFTSPCRCSQRVKGDSSLQTLNLTPFQVATPGSLSHQSTNCFE